METPVRGPNLSVSFFPSRFIIVKYGVILGEVASQIATRSANRRTYDRPSVGDVTLRSSVYTPTPTPGSMFSLLAAVRWRLSPQIGRRLHPAPPPNGFWLGTDGLHCRMGRSGNHHWDEVGGPCSVLLWKPIAIDCHHLRHDCHQPLRLLETPVLHYQLALPAMVDHHIDRTSSCFRLSWPQRHLRLGLAMGERRRPNGPFVLGRDRANWHDFRPVGTTFVGWLSFFSPALSYHDDGMSPASLSPFVFRRRLYLLSRRGALHFHRAVGRVGLGLAT